MKPRVGAACASAGSGGGSNFEYPVAFALKKPPPDSHSVKKPSSGIQVASTSKRSGRPKHDGSLYPALERLKLKHSKDKSDHTGTNATDDETMTLSDSSSSFGHQVLLHAAALGGAGRARVPDAGLAAAAAAAALRETDPRGNIEATDHSRVTTVMRGSSKDPMMDSSRNNRALLEDSRRLQGPCMEDKSISILEEQGHRRPTASPYPRSEEDASYYRQPFEDGSISLPLGDGSSHTGAGSRSYGGRQGRAIYYPRSEDGSVSLLDDGSFDRGGRSLHSGSRGRDYHGSYTNSQPRDYDDDRSYHSAYYPARRPPPHHSRHGRYHDPPYHHRHNHGGGRRDDHNIMAHSESYLSYRHNQDARADYGGRRLPRGYDNEPAPYDQPRHRGHRSMSHLPLGGDRPRDRGSYDYSRRGGGQNYPHDRNDEDDYYYHYDEGPRFSRGRRATERYDVLRAEAERMAARGHHCRRASDPLDGRSRYHHRREADMYRRHHDDEGEEEPEYPAHRRSAPERFLQDRSDPFTCRNRRGSNQLRRTGTHPLPRNNNDSASRGSSNRPGAYAATGRTKGATGLDQEAEEEKPDIFVEVAPGVKERLRRSDETKQAVEQDFYDSAACWACCTSPLFCIADVAFFICPECKCISPLDENTEKKIRQKGVGIAFTRDTLVQLQEEISQESRASLRR